jgi:hypothetical protein
MINVYGRLTQPLPFTNSFSCKGTKLNENQQGFYAYRCTKSTFWVYKIPRNETLYTPNATIFNQKTVLVIEMFYSSFPRISTLKLAFTFSFQLARCLLHCPHSSRKICFAKRPVR